MLNRALEAACAPRRSRPLSSSRYAEVVQHPAQRLQIVRRLEYAQAHAVVRAAPPPGFRECRRTCPGSAASCPSSRRLAACARRSSSASVIRLAAAVISPRRCASDARQFSACADAPRRTRAGRRWRGCAGTAARLPTCVRGREAPSPASGARRRATAVSSSPASSAIASRFHRSASSGESPRPAARANSASRRASRFRAAVSRSFRIGHGSSLGRRSIVHSLRHSTAWRVLTPCGLSDATYRSPSPPPPSLRPLA